MELKPEVLEEALENFETDSSLALLADGCCGYACTFSRQRCLCDDAALEALTDLLGDKTVGLLEQFRDTCLADNPELDFDITVPNTPICRKRSKKADKFVCSV